MTSKNLWTHWTLEALFFCWWLPWHVLPWHILHGAALLVRRVSWRLGTSEQRLRLQISCQSPLSGTNESDVMKTLLPILVFGLWFDPALGIEPGTFCAPGGHSTTDQTLLVVWSFFVERSEVCILDMRIKYPLFITWERCILMHFDAFEKCDHRKHEKWIKLSTIFI